MDIKERIASLEKEMADLKQQLEERPTHVKVPLSVFKFDNPQLWNLDKLNDAKMHELIAYLEDEVVEKMSIIVPW